MDLSKLNTVSRLETFLPSKKIAELDVGRTYAVTSMKFVNTKYGRQVVADIEKTFTIFLPNRTSLFLAEHMDLFNQMVQRALSNEIGLRYLGGKFNPVEFSEL